MKALLTILVGLIGFSVIACGGQVQRPAPDKTTVEPAGGQLGEQCLDNETCAAPWRCYAGECRHPCLVSKDCERDGQCGPHPKLFWSSKEQSWAITPFSGMAFKVGFDISESGLLSKKLCIPAKPAHCALSKACVEKGQCGLSIDPGKSADRAQPMCRATKAIHCQNSKQCKRSGKCTLAPDEAFTGCIKGAVDDAFCKKTAACKRNGACSAGPEGRCVVKSDADCRSGGICKSEGKCLAKDGQCIVSSNEGCAASVACKMAGGCAAVNGTCAPAEAAHCAGSLRCKMEGKCGLLNGECAPVEPQHCQGALCEMLGLCTVNASGYCEADAARCAQHRLCTDQGLCSVKVDDKMVVRKGRRKMTQNFKTPRTVCATADGFDCSSIKACAEQGTCSYDAQHNRCSALTDADCAKCQPCVEAGKTVASEGRCKKPRTGSLPYLKDRPAMPEGMDKECPTDRQCSKEGRCTATFIEYTGRWGCNPSSAAHCAESKKCKTHGLCAFDKDVESGPACVPDASRCAESDGCKKHGHCAATKHACRPALTRHCVASDACKEKGLCRLHPGEDAYEARCVKEIPLIDNLGTQSVNPPGKESHP